MNQSSTCPMKRQEVIEQYFMEHRAKLIDIAAFLDRYDRAPGNTGDDDFRLMAFRMALKVLNDSESNRAARILDLFSDHSTQVPQSAHGMKGATGAAAQKDGEGA